MDPWADKDRSFYKSEKCPRCEEKFEISNGHTLEDYKIIKAASATLRKECS